MEILYLLIPLSVVLVLMIGVVFWYALQSGQFDDLDLPAISVLADKDGYQGDNESHGSEPKNKSTNSH
jgi:cbb3-type cytochrome oxidase maturation protein